MFHLTCVLCPNRTLKGLSLSHGSGDAPISRDSQSPATRPLNRAARLPRPHGIWTRVVSLGDSRISSSLSLEHPSRKDSTHAVPPKTKIPGGTWNRIFGFNCIRSISPSLLFSPSKSRCLGWFAFMCSCIALEYGGPARREVCVTLVGCGAPAHLKVSIRLVSQI